MMNYVWSGLLIAALAFALWFDFGEIANDRYGNGRPVPVELEIPPWLPVTSSQTPSWKVTVRFNGERLVGHYRRGALSKEESSALHVSGELFRLVDGYELRITEPKLVAPLGAIRAASDETNKVLRARVIGLPADLSQAAGPLLVAAQLELPSVRFVKLRAITNAAFEFAKTAATLALGFIGIFALWMGLMKIAEASGLVSIFVTIVQPFLRLLFPEVPKGHPALGLIAMNLAANMLGLGNAATPMGIKAMEQLQELNPQKDTATNPMVMLLAINTAGVQLLPSATLVAVMGMSSLRVFLPIIIVTGISLVIAIFATKFLSRLPGFRRSNDPAASAEVSQ